MQRSTSIAVCLLSLWLGCGCSCKSDDSDAQHACTGNCPMTGGSGGTSMSTGAVAGSGGKSAASAGGAGGRSASPGDGGSAGDAGNADRGDSGLDAANIPSGSCPTIDAVVAAGKAAPGFEVLYAYKDAGQISKLGLSADHVYFIAWAGQIVRVPKAGGAAEIVRTQGCATLALTATDLIWSEDVPTDPFDTRIFKAAIGSSDAMVELADGLAASPAALLTDATHVYWLGGGPNGIGKVALAGGDTEKRLAPETPVTDFAFLGTDLYALHEASLLKVPQDGANPMMVAQLFFGGGIAADATNLYLVDIEEGTIKKWSPSMTTPTLLATQTNDVAGWPESLSAADGVVYWGEGHDCAQVYRVNADGTGHTMMMEGFSTVHETIADGSGLYVSDDKGLYRMDR